MNRAQLCFQSMYSPSLTPEIIRFYFLLCSFMHLKGYLLQFTQNLYFGEGDSNVILVKELGSWAGILLRDFPRSTHQRVLRDRHPDSRQTHSNPKLCCSAAVRLKASCLTSLSLGFPSSPAHRPSFKLLLHSLHSREFLEGLQPLGSSPWASGPSSH